MADWRPSASLSALRRRAGVLTKIRRFFEYRGVMEVDTPILSVAAATDLQVASFVTCDQGPGARAQQPLYLHTSPEFPMKRLLAAGAGSIYQICKVFRSGERGRWHNPEFTLLEWYRPGFDHHALMDEMDALLAEILGCPPAARLSYAEIFRHNVGIDPHQAGVAELRERAMGLGVGEALPLESLDRDGWLDLLLTHCIASTLGQRGRPSFVYDYPASQAALAQVRLGSPAVAERFEVYLGGVELANGFHELGDSQEQRWRFEADRAQRRRVGLPVVPLDEHLLEALDHGLPGCAGVALGIDRLLMAMMEATTIEEVMAFPIERA
ncbi:EF-P-lysine lysyltransferase [Gammaproteobacteria bacterium]